jgi:hypothetical protein
MTSAVTPVVPSSIARIYCVFIHATRLIEFSPYAYYHSNYIRNQSCLFWVDWSGCYRGAKPLWQGSGGVPQLLKSPKSGGFRGLKIVIDFI